MSAAATSTKGNTSRIGLVLTPTPTSSYCFINHSSSKLRLAIPRLAPLQPKKQTYQELYTSSEPPNKQTNRQLRRAKPTLVAAPVPHSTPFQVPIHQATMSFHLLHIPALLVATTTTFGGIWPLVTNPRASMLEFGFPQSLADNKAAHPGYIIGQARGTVIGLLIATFYFRAQFEAVDTILTIVGFWAGTVDSLVVWRAGNGSKAVFRLVASWVIGAMGLWGITASSGR